MPVRPSPTHRPPTPTPVLKFIGNNLDNGEYQYTNLEYDQHLYNKHFQEQKILHNSKSFAQFWQLLE